MWNKHLFGLTLGLAVSFGATQAHAIPTVAIDMNPGLPGIQSTVSVLPGNSFGVDVVISGVVDDMLNPFDGVGGFELDVNYDSTIVSAISAVTGGYLGIAAFNFENDLTSPDVNFAEVDFSPLGHFGDGILVSMSFLAVGGGTSLLDLNDVLLSGPFGFLIPQPEVYSGSVTVTPEPTSLLLFGSGLVGFGIWANRKSKFVK